MRVAAYARQSQDRQGEEWGVERQLQDIQRMAENRRWEVVEEFIDNDVSATKNRKRPAFEHMLSRLGEFDVIASKHMDRLLRRVAELERVLELCKDARTYIVTSADGVDTSTDGGRLVARILSSVAQGEIERKSARQIAAGQQAAAQGRWTGGKRPFGYTWEMEPEPTEAAFVKQAYMSVLAGESLYGIAKGWNDGGVLTTSGNRWNGQTVRQMLMKPRYAGLRSYKDSVVGAGQWQALIAEDVWSAVETILTRPDRRKSRSTARKYLLSGILLCGECGKPMRSGMHAQPVYRCKACMKVQRVQHVVDEAAQKLILGFMASPKAKILLVDDKRDDMDELRASEIAVQARLDQLPIDYADGLLTARDVKLAREKLEADLEAVRQKQFSATRSALFKGLVTKEPLPVWEGFSLDRKRSVFREVVELTLLTSGGGVPFGPEHLKYRWLHGEE